MPSFWRPLGLGPNALPHRSLRRVATSSLRPPPSGLRGPEVPGHRPEGSSSVRADAPRAPGRDLACFLASTRREEPCGCSWLRAELRGRRRPGREPRAQGRSPRCLRVPSRASPAPGSARRRCGDTAGRGQGEERAERGLAPGRPGLAGPRLRQSAGADAGGGSGALGYQRARRGAPGARRCGCCAPGRPAAPARSPLCPARPFALPSSPLSHQPGLSAAA